MTKKKIVIDIGCGDYKLKANNDERVIGIDYQKTKGVNIVHNLEKPLPFTTNYADSIYSNHTFEHILNAKNLIEECWRVTKPEGQIFIRVPHYSHTTMYSDMTHKTFFGSRSFDFYVKGTDLSKMSGYQNKVEFVMLKKTIVFDVVYKLIEKIVNINDNTRKIYEWFFAWIFPAREIIFILRPVK